MTTLALISQNGTAFTLPRECADESLYIKEFRFDEGEEAIVDLPDIDDTRLRYAVQYLTYSCNEPERLQELASTSYLEEIPDLHRFMYGYLGINSFNDFYNEMILTVLRAPQQYSKAPAWMLSISDKILNQLTDAEIYSLVRLIPQRVNDLYGVPNGETYLLFKLERDRMASLEGSRYLLQITQKGELYIDDVRIPHPVPVIKVFTNSFGMCGIIDINGTFHWMTNPDKTRTLILTAKEVSYRVKDASISHNRAILLSEEGDVYVHEDVRDWHIARSNIREPLRSFKVDLPFKCLQVVDNYPRAYFLTETGEVFRYTRVSEDVDQRHQLIKVDLPQPVRIMTNRIPVESYSMDVQFLFDNLTIGVLTESADLVITTQYAYKNHNHFTLTPDLDLLGWEDKLIAKGVLDFAVWYGPIVVYRLLDGSIVRSA